MAYKVVSNILANRLKSGLSEEIENERFGFLINCQILDAIGVVKEGIHSIKVKKFSSLVLKIDLNKAYDRVDWTFLRLVLLQIGLNLRITKWIMGCVVLVPKYVLFSTL